MLLYKLFKYFSGGVSQQLSNKCVQYSRRSTDKASYLYHQSFSSEVPLLAYKLNTLEREKIFKNDTDSNAWRHSYCSGYELAQH